MVQRGHNFAIVDEVDSILIDEARTPLIISGPAEESTDLYYEVDRIIPKLKPRRGPPGPGEDRGPRAPRSVRRLHRRREGQDRHAHRSGMAKAEQLLAHRLQPGGLYDPANMPLLHHVQQALRAHTLYQLDVEYMIKDGEVVIVDEFTGRLMPAAAGATACTRPSRPRRGVKIERENQTLATITFQNYFRKYKKLSRHDRHGRNRGPGVRQDLQARRHGHPDQPADAAHRGTRPRLPHRSREVRRRSSTTSSTKQNVGRPVLVGTVSIEKSEKLSAMLKRRGIKHVVLNAKYHAQEAEIVAQAGRRAPSPSPPTWPAAAPTSCSAATPSTWRASSASPKTSPRSCRTRRGAVRRRRRVRLLLPPRQLLPRADGPTGNASIAHFKQQCDAEHEEVVARGGLHILGTERHEARRIDNQLRGRAGRQGDPGSLALLPVARRRPDAHLRVGPHLGPDAAPRHGRRRADRARHGQPRHRARAEAGRGAELRRPQAPARVRRRDEQAARERLHAAPRECSRATSTSTRGRRRPTRAATCWPRPRSSLDDKRRRSTAGAGRRCRRRGTSRRCSAR